MDTSKGLHEVLMSLREATAPDTPMTEDQVEALDVIENMDDTMQGIFKALGEVMLQAIDEFGVDPTDDS